MGLAGLVKNYSQAYDAFTAHDKPQSACVELGLSFQLPKSITFLGSNILISLNGIPYFHDEKDRTIPLFTNLSTAFPNLAGQQISEFLIGLFGINSGPGYFNRHYEYSEVNLSAQLQYDLYFHMYIGSESSSNYSFEGKIGFYY